MTKMLRQLLGADEAAGDRVYEIELGSLEFWSPLFCILIFHFFFFWVSWFRKDNGMIDIAWGLDFIIANVVIIVIRIANGGVADNLDARMILNLLMVAMWGLRMSIHVVLRTELGKEDRRFADLREKLTAGGGTVLVFCVSFFGVWMTNSLFIVAIASSSIFISMFSDKSTPLGALDIVGIVVWLVGFCILTVADHQLRLFKVRRAQDQTMGQRLCKEGLWAYSRHPNYFGEALLWWGIYLMACSIEHGWKTMWSPILILLLLRFVSGVPTVEGLYKDDPEFQQWCQTTNVFVPLPRRTAGTAEGFEDMKDVGQ